MHTLCAAESQRMANSGPSAATLLILDYLTRGRMSRIAAESLTPTPSQGPAPFAF